MVRVLVVEDSDTVRALLVAIIQEDEELTVVGEARDGAEAVRLASRLRPDVISMDILMPVMDGFEATKRIMGEVPTPVVLVTSNLDVAEAEKSMHAMRLGALHAMLKPSGPGYPTFEREAAEYRNVLRTFSQVKVIRHWKRAETPARRPLPASLDAEDRRPAPQRLVRAVAIAASTGGPGALQKILGDLPPGFPVPILVVQHICTGFVRSLASSLNLATRLRVKVAEHGEPLLEGVVYLAPDGMHLGVEPRRVVLHEGSAGDGFVPSANHLFESVGRAFGRSALAIILTGMGEDGVAGLLSLRNRGGYVLAQDEQSCVVYGMPRTALAAGAVDEVVSLNGLATRIGEVVRHEPDR